MRTGARIAQTGLVLIVVAGFVGGDLLGGGAVGGGICGFLAAVLIQLVAALLPLSLHPAASDGAELTQAVRRTWADRLLGRLHLGGPGTAATDLARLDAGTRLALLSYGTRDGSQVMGRLLLQRLPDGAVAAAWQNRRSTVIEPIVPPLAFAVQEGRVQQNRVQARFGMTGSVELGGGSYWVRPMDAELLQLAFASEPAAQAKQAKQAKAAKAAKRSKQTAPAAPAPSVSA